MYQFYYSKEPDHYTQGTCSDHMYNHLSIEAIRPTMWEEHCLECSAPLCYKNCLHYVERSDGRCKRFDNSFEIQRDNRGCCGQRAHIKFRKWANMMTIVFPSMLPLQEYCQLTEKNQILGGKLKWIVNSSFPVKVKWEIIRTIEFLRRKKLRRMRAGTAPDAFVFHGYSYEDTSYNLILEVYDDHTPLFRTALHIVPGENLIILKRDVLSEECWKPNNLIKIYPENDLEAELDLLWCDFVKCNEVIADKPAAKVKCVVWDLDDTLWNGTLIETEESADLKLRDSVLSVIQELDHRGIVQSIASKNDFDTAWPVLERLGLAEYFLYPQIHWKAKSSSVKEIAHQLNIGLDSLALIDDSLFERQQVSSVYPQVRVYDNDIIQDLLTLPEFDVLVTEESKQRREMYRAEEKRNVLREQDNEDTVAFLRKCQLHIDLFEPKTDAEIDRCYELVVRTNQLNMSGKKYTPDEFREVLHREGCCNFAFSCSDIFGSYGIVGFGQYKVDNQNLIFTEFAMSCRVAGKYVESALFTALLSIMQCQRGFFSVNKTKKNILLRRTLNDIGCKTRNETEKSIEYEFEQELVNNKIVSVSLRDTEEWVMKNDKHKVPMISVIMGVYNCENTVSEAIESVISQTFQDFEFIICDDGSTDNTYKIVETYAKEHPAQIVLIKNDRNRGLNYTLNHCLRYASGQYIARMDGDDLSLPERFEKEIAYFNKHPEIAILGASLRVFDKKGVWGTHTFKEYPQPLDFVHGTPFSHSVCMVRREAYDAVDGYSDKPALLRVEDYHLWAKMYSKGFRGANLSEELYMYRDDRAGYQKRKYKYRLNEAYVTVFAITSLKLPKWRYIYALKPLLVGLLPYRLYNILHKKKMYAGRS